MQDLYTSDYEGHKSRNRERAPGTCEWVFYHPDYLDWRSRNASSLLWVSADPGCGKSVLASFLVDTFKSSEFQEVLSSIVCYFFFKDDSDEQDNAISAVSSILHQLFSATPQLIKHALEQYQKKGKKLFSELRSLWGIFVSAALDATSKKVICVIDGLDECRNPSQDEFFHLLSEFCAKCTRQGEERTYLKILLLSRPYSFIEDVLYHPLTIRMKMEDESNLIGADVELVIRDRISRFGSKRKISDQVQKRLIDRLISSAGQTFLWVSLVLADLESSLRASEMKLAELVSQIPTNLNDMYEKILGKSQSPKDAQKILYIIVGAVRPLSLAEMNIAFVIKPEDRNHDDLDLEPAIEMTIRNLCGLFVKVVDSKIYLVHQTAREFLIGINNPRMGDLNAWQNSLDLLEADNILAQICTSYLMLEGFEEQPLLLDCEPYWKLIDQYLEKHDFLHYAAVNWLSHFRKVQNRATSIMIESVLNICNTQCKRFQTWCAVVGASAGCPPRYPLGPFPKSTSLHVASYYGCETIVNLFLERGANINAYDIDKKTSLMLAVVNGQDAVTKLFLERGAEMNNVDKFGETPLHMAIKGGHESTVKLLLQHDASSDVQNEDEDTALFIAIKKKKSIYT